MPTLPWCARNGRSFAMQTGARSWPGLAGQRSPLRIRGMTAWFGVRGIGSLYYLMYAIEHGLPKPLALQLVQLTLIVVTLSILLHGFSVKPLLGMFRRRS
jgi:NhaP-type Na+/H+ or K+/H+ antiporter